MNPGRMQFPRRQKGVVLFVSLILLLILTLLGVTLARTQTVEERLAQNEDNHQIAFQAAEAALHAGMADMAAGSYNSGAVQLTPALFSQNTGGFYDLTSGNEPSQLTVPSESIANVVNWSNPALVLAYDGPALSNLPALAQVPVFLIEKLPQTSLPASGCASAQAYRVTAHGFGADGTAGATLQQIFYRC